MPPDLPDRLTRAQLFIGFFRAGIIGFGGTLPVTRRMLVEERKWLTAEGFNELFALCQFLPGANIVNLSFAFGARHRGLSGAAAAVLGLLGAPVCIVIALAGAYARFGGIPAVQHGLAGLAAAAAGLILGTAAKIAEPVFKSALNIALAALVFGLVALAHVAMPVAMALSLPAGLLIAWRTGR